MTKPGFHVDKIQAKHLRRAQSEDKTGEPIRGAEAERGLWWNHPCSLPGARSSAPVWLLPSTALLSPNQNFPYIKPSNTLRLGFPGGSDGKESACSAGDLDSIPG